MLRDVNEKIVMIWLSLLGSPNYRIYRALLSEFGTNAGIYDAFSRGEKPGSLSEFPKAAGKFADRELAETALGFYRKAQESGMREFSKTWKNSSVLFSGTIETCLWLSIMV